MQSRVTLTVGLSLILSLVACGAVYDRKSDALSSNPDAGVGADTRTETDAQSGPAADAAGNVSDATTRSDVDAPNCSAAVEGNPCGNPGSVCTPSPCTDPCQFCNILSCQSGRWETMEAFPLPQTECAPSFACGSFTCKRGEFCVARHSGPMPLEGGSGLSYECVDLQTTCGGGCACALSAAKALNLACTPTTCDAPAGGPVVQCYGI